MIFRIYSRVTGEHFANVRVVNGGLKRAIRASRAGLNVKLERV